MEKEESLRDEGTELFPKAKTAIARGRICLKENKLFVGDDNVQWKHLTAQGDISVEPLGLEWSNMNHEM